MATTIGTTDIAKDGNWIENSFMLAGGILARNSAITRSRNLSSADFKYTTSGFGRHTVVNPPPQFTPLADIRRAGLAGLGNSANNKEGYMALFQGQGRAWSEMYDDNMQKLHVRAGITQMKGLVTFFTNFYDNESAMLARQGRASISYYFGLAAGSIGTLFLQPVILAGKAAKFFLGRPSSRYMDLKPTMPLYWERVQVIMNNIGAQLGIIPRFYKNTGAFGTGADSVSDLNTAASADYKAHLSRIMPKIFDSNGSFNVIGAMQQAPRMEAEYSKRVSELTYSSGGGQAAYDEIINVLSAPIAASKGLTMENYLKTYHGGVLGSISDKKLDGDTAADILEKAVNSGDTTTLQKLSDQSKAANQDSNSGQSSGGDTAAASASNTTAANTNNLDAALNGTSTDSSSSNGSSTDTTREMRTTVKAKPGVQLSTADKTELQKEINEGTSTSMLSRVYETVSGWMGDFKESFDTDFDNGTAFVSFAVDYTGPGSLSIQNATKETTISQTMKNISGTSRDSRISMSDFNTGFGFIDGALGMVRNVMAGVADSVQMSGLLALAGNAFTNFPKQWDDSTTTVPTASFSIHVRSAYGNDLAHYMNVYPVIACLLGLTSPLSTGTQSYTSPFVCEAYCRGVCNIRYGMVTSLSIRHGSGNLGYKADTHRSLGFDIDFEIADLSSTFHAPISNGMSPVNIFKHVFDDDNTFNDYLSTITGLSLDDMVNPKRKLAIRMATQAANVKSWWTPEHLASRLVGSTPVQVLNKIFGPSYFPGT